MSAPEKFLRARTIFAARRLEFLVGNAGRDPPLRIAPDRVGGRRGELLDVSECSDAAFRPESLGGTPICMIAFPCFYFGR